MEKCTRLWPGFQKRLGNDLSTFVLGGKNPPYEACFWRELFLFFCRIIWKLYSRYKDEYFPPLVGGGALSVPNYPPPTIPLALAPHVIPTQLHNCLETTPRGIPHIFQLERLIVWEEIFAHRKTLFEYNVGIGGRKFWWKKFHMWSLKCIFHKRFFACSGSNLEPSMTHQRSFRSYFEMKDFQCNFYILERYSFGKEAIIVVNSWPLKVTFLPDPSVHGVRSMGLGLSKYLHTKPCWNFADVTLG